jgi:hypothetical protein
MASGAGPLPFGNILGDVRAIDALVPIANLGGFLLPELSMAGSLAG